MRPLIRRILAEPKYRISREKQNMSAQTKTKNKPGKKSKTAANIVWFEIPADDIARAKKFYGTLFGWKINALPVSPVADYQHIDTGGADASPDGGMMKRMHSTQTIT